MPATTVVVTATASVVLPFAKEGSRQWIDLVLDKDQVQDVFISFGDKDLTTANGMPMRCDPDNLSDAERFIENGTLSRPANAALWAVTASGTATLRISWGH